MKSDRAFIGLLKLGKTLAQVARGVRHVFHDVGCEPHIGYSSLLVTGENFERLTESLHAVVDTGKYVAVPVGGALKTQGLLFAK